MRHASYCAIEIDDARSKIRIMEIRFQMFVRKVSYKVSGFELSRNKRDLKHYVMEFIEDNRRAM